MTSVANDAKDQAPLIDVSGLTLDELESADSSALGAALARVAQERTAPREHTAFHTDHTDSHSSSPW